MNLGLLYDFQMFSKCQNLILIKAGYNDMVMKEKNM